MKFTYYKQRDQIDCDPTCLRMVGKYYGRGFYNTKTNNDQDIKDFASVEVLPEFEGGMAGWSEYLSKTLKYPDEAKKNQIQGRVTMSFIVQKEGSLTDIKVLRGIGSGADEEAIRVLNESPKWKPGIQNGKTVNVAYVMPIFFQLPVKNN